MKNCCYRRKLKILRKVVKTVKKTVVVTVRGKAVRRSVKKVPVDEESSDEWGYYGLTYIYFYYCVTRKYRVANQ